MVPITDASILRGYIRDIPDFPKPGIAYKDITPLLKHPSALALAVEFMVQPFRGKGIDVVAGAESRGFIFGTAVAKSLSVGFVPIRKPGKLPAQTRKHSYQLEYGTDSLEIHEDALEPGQRVLLVDDVLATGGTLEACIALVSGLKATVHAIAVLIELEGLQGRDRLGDFDVHCVMKY